VHDIIVVGVFIKKITTEDTRGMYRNRVSFKDDITAISKLNGNLNP